MTTSTLTPATDSLAASNPTATARTAVLAYGVVSYAVGVSALVGWIVIMLGLVEFPGLGMELSLASATAFNLLLMVAFGLQHSIMARPAFKEKWSKLMPRAMERATFVLATGLVLGPVLLLWQPASETVWSVELPALRTGLIVLAMAGWAYLFLASFAINHFELFGLRQVYQYFRGQKVTGVPFKERLMYRFDRHPIMTGAIVGMWATPEMSVDHLLFSIMATLYIVIGVYFEERSLRRQWGATYDDYCKRVGTIVPSFSRPGSAR